MIRSSRFLALVFTILLTAGSTGLAAEADISRGEKLHFAKGCDRCHGKAGISRRDVVPNLAGQNAKYLRKQLISFRRSIPKSNSGFKISERLHPKMDKVAMVLSNQEILDLAGFYKSLTCAASRSKAAIQRPREAKKCDFCHGDNGNSPFIAYPKLAGQNEAYLIKHLELFIQSAEFFPAPSTRTHRMMLPSALDLNLATVKRLAKYYASQSCR